MKSPAELQTENDRLTAENNETRELLDAAKSVTIHIHDHEINKSMNGSTVFSYEKGEYLDAPNGDTRFFSTIWDAFAEVRKQEKSTNV